MTNIPRQPDGVFPPYRGHVHAMEVSAGSRLLFISGLNGYETDGTTMPDDFDGQAALIWRHIRTVLSSAGMGIENLVSLRTYLADPADDEANARMRQQQLGAHRVSSTVICCRLLETKWKLEVEAVAAG
jgi:enamine deaminase RidA (YjgF/YER057c/UK114 family)